MSNDIPQSWHPYLERKGIPVSYRGLAGRVGMSHEAVRRVVRGWSVKPSSIVQVADALGVDPEVVYELRGESPHQPVPWEPPVTSALLTHEERETLNRLVNLLTANRRREDGATDEPATTTDPAPAAAPAPAPGRPPLSIAELAHLRRVTDREVAAWRKRPGVPEEDRARAIAGLELRYTVEHGRTHAGESGAEHAADAG